MDKQVQRHKKVITNKTMDIAFPKQGQKSDSAHVKNNFKNSSKNKSCFKQSCEEMFDKCSQVVKSVDHDPTTDDTTNNQLTNTNVMDSSINLSSPGLCSALQLATEIELAFIEIKKPKQLKMYFERNEKQDPKVVRKANIPFTKHIFRNLVDLHINDDDIVPGKSLKTKHTSYDKKGDSAFILSNFYKPSFSKQCCSQIQNQTVDVEKVEFYHGIDIYNYAELFNSL